MRVSIFFGKTRAFVYTFDARGFLSFTHFVCLFVFVFVCIFVFVYKTNFDLETMPLVVIVGTPCAGKSTFAKHLLDSLKHPDVELISDEHFFERSHPRNVVYKGVLSLSLSCSNSFLINLLKCKNLIKYFVHFFFIRKNR